MAVVVTVLVIAVVDTVDAIEVAASAGVVVLI